MWRPWLEAAVRTVIWIILGVAYVMGHFVLGDGIEAVAMIISVSLLAAGLVSIVLGRARYLYVAVWFICIATTLYSLRFSGVPLDSIFVAIVPIVGVSTIVYGAAELREQGGEPYRDPIVRLFGEDDDFDDEDPICVPTATLLADHAHDS